MLITPSSSPWPFVVIGGGPSGLFAAERLIQLGQSVSLYDRMPSVGRKFLVAGRGGLNLTHSEDHQPFAQRYSASPSPEITWPKLLADFPPDALRAWARDLGVETFIGTSGRVFPETKQAAPLLRRWVLRLKQQGVIFHHRHEWLGLRRGTSGYIVTFATPDKSVTITASHLILALGGGSWPQTGSNAAWVPILEKLGVVITPLQSANCGYEVAWPADFLHRAEGHPIKNITVTAGTKTVAGELLVTSYGLEGGALYQLGAELRALKNPSLLLDLKPSASVEQLLVKLGMTPFSFKHAIRCWRLGTAAAALIKQFAPLSSNAREIAHYVKHFPLPLLGPRPLAEAISTAGGVASHELDAHLQLKKYPGVFCVGEMLDWTAPTGGYLLQGCFATAARAAQAFEGK